MKTFVLTQPGEFQSIALADGWFYASKKANDTLESMQAQDPQQVLKMSWDDVQHMTYEKNDAALLVKFRTSFKAMSFTFEKAEDIPSFLEEIKTDKKFAYSEKRMGLWEAAGNNMIALLLFWAFGGILLYSSHFTGTGSGGKISGLLRLVNLVKDKLGTIGFYLIIAVLVLLPAWFLYGRIKYQPVKVELLHR